MASIAVISDDLTGGNAVGAEFAKLAYSVSVTGHPESVAGLAAKRDVLVINTDTRNAEPRAAALKCAKAARLAVRSGIKVVIKKIDSLMRGNIAEEIEAIAHEFGHERCLLVPGAPSVGRTTVNGVQFVDGRKLEEAILAADPSATPAGSQVAAFFKNRTNLPLHRIDLADFSSGDQVLRKKLGDLGQGIIISDAETETHVERVVEAAYACGIRFFAGTYGIGKPLAQHLDAAREAARLVIISGSLSDRSREQVDTVAAEERCVHAAMDIRFDMSPVEAEAVTEQTRTMVTQAAEADFDLVLSTSADSRESARFRKDRSPIAVSEMEGTIASLVLSVAGPLLAEAGAIIVSGGSTANAVLEALGAESLTMHGREVLPGMPLCTISGGPHDGLFFLTKPGSFGNARSLSDARRILKRIMTEEGSAMR